MNGWMISFELNKSQQTNGYGVTICFDDLCKSISNCSFESNIFLGNIG